MIARRGLWLATAGLLIATVLGCGGGRSGAPRSVRPSSVVWQSAPQIFQPRGLPRDRVLIGRIRNPGTSMLVLQAAQVVVRDRVGRRVPGTTAAFVASYAHGLFGALQQPAVLPRGEAVRLGRLLYLFGGASAPFFAAWHLPSEFRAPLSLQIGRFRLAVPSGAPKLTAR